MDAGYLHATLASYVAFEGPNMKLVYGLFAAIVAVFLAMGLFRMLARYRESLQVQKSSWRTFEKIAKVKGLSRIEIELLSMVLRRTRTKRPSQVLGSITTFDRLVDQAVDRAWIADDEQAHLESARTKLVRTSQVWDGHTDRRQFERAPFGLEILTAAVTKEAIDEELKTSYSETDEKFFKAFDSLVAEARTESTQIRQLGAGGLALLVADKDQFHPGDYLAFSEGSDTLPFNLQALRGRIIELDRMEDQHQAELHVAFLPYDADLRKEVIGAVYEAAERAEAESREKADKTKAKKKAPKRKVAPKPKPKPKSPAPSDTED